MAVGKTPRVAPRGAVPQNSPVNDFTALSRADILRQVRQLASHLKGIPSPGEIRRHFGLALGGEIDALFGSTDRLITEAKLANRLYTDADLLMHLSYFKERLGHDPSLEEIDADLTMPGAMHYIKRFGGIEKSLARLKEGVPAPVKMPPSLPRNAPLPVVARAPNGSTIVSSPSNVPTPVASQPTTAPLNGSILLEDLLRTLANVEMANGLLQVQGMKDLSVDDAHKLPTQLTFFVALNEDKTTVTVAVFETSDWQARARHVLNELGEALYYVKVSSRRYVLKGFDGKETTIRERLGWGHVQAPDEAAKRREQKGAQGDGREGYAILECPIAKPFFTPAELKKVEPLVTLPVNLPTAARGYAPSRVEWKDLATKPSVGRFNGVLARPGGAKRSSEPNAVLTFLVGLAALAAGVRLLRAPNLSPAMPSGSLFQSPKEDWDQSGT